MPTPIRFSTPRPERQDWSRLILDGDWAVQEYWSEFNSGVDGGDFTPVTPERIRYFMAYLVRLIDGEPVAS